MSYRFHVLGIQHTASNSAHIGCAFTQKVVKLCKMLKSKGHHVIHYGGEGSSVDCDEHVTCATGADLNATYGEGNGIVRQYQFDINDEFYGRFNAVAICEIAKRKLPLDFLLCMWGNGHRAIAMAHPDMIQVEPGIGYGQGHFARWKVFESYALLHAYAGLNPVVHARGVPWYDVVIPNAFDVADFTYNDRRKGDYLLHLGRIGEAKGTQTAIEVARATGIPLIIAGAQGSEKVKVKPGDPVTFTGFADREMRRKLLSEARALIAPSNFIEPFCGVAVEAMLSGTPVITADFGGPTETVVHGSTGYRCRTLDHFIWAARNVDRLHRRKCRAWAVENYSLERVAGRYEEFWQMVMDTYTGNGWYVQHPDRGNLDWLKFKGRV
jgi:glycosyltransferase involved in cell wall biosynthesis